MYLEKRFWKFQPASWTPARTPVTGALRELKEETGAVPDIFLPLGRILPAPGCYGEALYLFLARGLHMEEQALDPDEFLQVSASPFRRWSTAASPERSKMPKPWWLF